MLSGGERFRLLIYSHDSFGLGHLSRCRAIAHSLVEHRRDVSVLILSGLPIIGSYSFRSRVDFIRFPGVVKLRDGNYTARGLDISIEDAIQIRQTIIQSAAETFRPNVFLVDKEPLGLRGEVLATLQMLKERGTRLVLGLRDVMDDPGDLRREWERKEAVPVLSDLYDNIWIYGCEGIYDPLAGIDITPAVRKKIRYTGYLRRTPDAGITTDDASVDAPSGNYILVTPGGGGDGAALVDWVLRAYEHDLTLPYHAHIVTGPFMPNERQAEYRQRAERLDKVTVTRFVSSLEPLMRRSLGVVAMGGYNTFCEILSYDRPALIVPRTIPRMEQFIRAERMQQLGLVQMLPDNGHPDPLKMAKALRALPHRRQPSAIHVPGLLDGFANINSTVDRWLSEARQHPLTGRPDSASISPLDQPQPNGGDA